MILIASYFVTVGRLALPSMLLLSYSFFCRATPSAQTVLPQMADLCMTKSGRSSKRRVGATARFERDNRGSPFFVRERLREEVLPALSVLGAFSVQSTEPAADRGVGTLREGACSA